MDPDHTGEPKNGSPSTGTASVRPGFSRGIDIAGLERENRRLLAFGTFAGCVFLLFIAFLPPAGERTAATAARMPPKRIVIDLIPLPPYPREPFHLSRPRQSPRTMIVRPYRPALPSGGIGMKKMPPPEPVFRERLLLNDGELADVSRGMLDSLTVDSGVPRKPDPRITLPRANFDDPGMYRADIIYNPADKRAAHGFVHIPLLRGPGFLSSDVYRNSLRGLVSGINRHTNVTAVLDVPREGITWQTQGSPVIKDALSGPGIALDSLLTCRPPFVYLLLDGWIYLSPREKEVLLQYLLGGGFLFVENAMPGSRQAYDGIHKLLSEIFSPNASSGSKDVPKIYSPRASSGYKIVPAYENLPRNHPLFHCFYDLPDGPPPLWGRAGNEKPRIEGMSLGGRLLVVYSDNGYGYSWADGRYSSDEMKLGVNLVMYGIVQERGRSGHMALKDTEARPVPENTASREPPVSRIAPGRR